MSVNQGYREGIKKTAKFFWRHFFTLADLSLSINVLVFNTLLWKNALISLSIAITIDWAKQFIKLTPNKSSHSRSINPSDDIYTPLHARQWWNSSIPETPTNLMNNSYSRY